MSLGRFYDNDDAPDNSNDDYGIASSSSGDSVSSEPDDESSVTEESYDYDDDDDDDVEVATISGTESSDDDDDDDAPPRTSIDEEFRVPFLSYVRVLFVDAFLRFKNGRGAAPYRRSLDVEEAHFRASQARDDDDDDDDMYVDHDAEIPRTVIVREHTLSIEQMLRAATIDHGDAQVRALAAELVDTPSPQLVESIAGANVVCSLTNVQLAKGTRTRRLGDAFVFDESALDVFNAVALLVNFESIARCALLSHFDDACVNTTKRARTSRRTSASPSMGITSALLLLEHATGDANVIDGLFARFTHALVLLGVSEDSEDDKM